MQSVQPPRTLQAGERRGSLYGSSLCRREGKPGEVAAAHGLAAIRVHGEAGRQGAFPPEPVQHMDKAQSCLAVL